MTINAPKKRHKNRLKLTQKMVPQALRQKIQDDNKTEQLYNAPTKSKVAWGCSMSLVFIFCLEGTRGCAAHLPMMFPAREKHDSLDALVAGPRARRRSWGKTVVSALIRNFRNGRRGRRTTTSRVHWSRSGEKHGQHSENGWSLKFKSKKNKPAKRVRTTSDLSLLKIKRSRKKCSPPPGRFFLPCREKKYGRENNTGGAVCSKIAAVYFLGIADFWHTKKVASKSEILPIWSNSVNMTPITCFRSKNRYISVWRLSGLVLASGGTLRFKNTKKIVCCKKQKKTF